ncbi:MAG: extracellular solute-binding protein [Bacillota bacterium]|nr:extracellular solute-binding protein [Bacillota bacterium]
MKAYKLISLTIALMFLCAGCSENSNLQRTHISATEALTKKKIVFSTNSVTQQLKQLAKEFEQKNPNIEVEIEFMPEVDKTYNARIAVNELTDITVIPQIPDNPSDYFVPLNDLGFSSDDFIIPMELSYAIPIGANYDGMIYNKAAFKEAGINKAPATMDELYDACKKLKAKGITPLAINLKDKWPTQWYTLRYPIEYLNNPDYWAELSDKEKFLTNDSPILKILLTLRDLNKKGYLEHDVTNSDWNQMRKDMAFGKIAMTFLGSWFIPQLIENGAAPSDIGMFPFPGTKCVELFYDYHYAISKNSKNIDAAKAFMKFAWEGSKISKALGMSSPFKDSNNNIDAIKELLSYNIPTRSGLGDTSSFTSMIVASNINLQSDLCSDFILSDNPDNIVREYNKRWLDGRKKLGK